MGVGTPAELKTEENGSMRLEMILEPGKEIPELPDFLLNTISSNRRILSRIEQPDISQALELAQGLKNKGAIEEFSLSPTTLEDVYVKIVGHLEEDESEGVSN
jgi:ABC-2 type transport system ATP-binding protein